MIPIRSAASNRGVWPPIINHTVAVPGAFVALVVLAAAALNVAAWTVLTETGVRAAVLDPIASMTAGVVQPTFLVYAVFGVVIASLFWARGYAPGLVGLRRKDLRTAIVIVGGVWLVAQTTTIVVSVATTGTVLLAPTLATGGLWTLLGLFLAQVLGNALYEEVLYRGFLLTALHARFVKHMRNWPFIAALALSQSIFALVHVPSRLVEDVVGISLAANLFVVFLTGIGFALLYYRTRNLLLVVGVHALLNYPTVVFGTEQVAILTVVAVSLVLVVTWPLLEKRLQAGITESADQPAAARPPL
ncbi:CPBP family intramembrane glutamic endopeptidase [Halorubrum halophilum]|uniref:CPBP family intramembrane glutamic endopeptidase n=1 Tax=Halorubrum halophilum TaxID=413816 RepID=UPI00186B4A2F|nr:CPBP family intramembrane glutamic endopeptidase [Halorubrum halophilum]